MNVKPGAERLPHVVVIGCGFAGINAVKALPPGEVRVTVIDRQNHHLFQPLLYQVATAGLSAVSIAQPIRAFFSDRTNLEVVMAEVTAIYLAAREVTHERGTVGYDYLIVAAGSETSFFGHADWEKMAPGLKTLDDALRIRRLCLCAFERAETESDPEKAKDLMTTVVVGAGATGVELAGNFAELARTVLRKDFDHIDPTKARVILIGSGPRVLESFSPELSASAQRQLEKLGVEVRNGVRVESIEPGLVMTKGESIKAGTIIWAAGVCASPLGKMLGAPLGHGGRVKVLPDLSVPGHPEVFAVGDLIELTDAKGVKVPGVAQGAIQTGKYVARLILSDWRSKAAGCVPKARKPFSYYDKGSMATIGRSAAVAQIGKLEMSGMPAWLAWATIHLLFLVGFRSKFAVLMQWVYSYFTYKRGARVITGVSGERSAGSA